MVDGSGVFVGMDVSKDRHAAAVADGGRDGEVRSCGEVGSDGASGRHFVRKLKRPGRAAPLLLQGRSLNAVSG
ncbi:MAG: hypothetical protein OXC10_17290 [Rhodospirillaceae bacterium]|nr:hypothetical protein [Rhodospirillaceae bacterium]